MFAVMGTVALSVCAVYFRCSKDRNDQASVSEQEQAGVARCQTQGWEPRRYQDNDRSASRYAKKGRDDWPRLLADLRAGLLAVVWLWESSRGDRKAYEWLGFLELCRDRAVMIYVETHQRLYDPRIARDWKVLAEDGIDSAYESDKTSLRVRRDLAAAAAKGRPHGQPPYGLARRYDPVTGAYVTQEPDPPASDVAAGIITAIARNDPLGRIRDDLNGRGVSGPAGGRWDRHTLRLIGLNPAYAGFRLPPRGGADPEPDWMPVVSLETHLAAVAVLTGPARSPRPGRQRHLLSYLGACGACGSLFWVRTTRGGGQYSCRAHGCVNVSIAWLDELVTALACAKLSQPDAAELYRSDSTGAARHRGEAARLRAELDDWAAADITARAYQIREAKLALQIERAERAAAAAEVPLVLRELLTAQNVRAGWDHLGVTARRAVIRALMTVTVAKAPDLTRASRTDPARVTIGWVRP